MPAFSFDDPHDVQTPAITDDVLAAYGEVLRQDVMFHAYKPIVRCYQSLNQTVHSGSPLTMPFDLELGGDVYGLRAPLAPTKIIIPSSWGAWAPVGVWVRLGANIGWAATTNAGRRYASVQVNGSGIVVGEDERTPNPVNGNAIHNFKCEPWVAFANDYFELFMLQDSGVDIQIPAASYLPAFSLEYLGLAG